MVDWIWVASGGALGACVRFAVARSMASQSTEFPFGTLVANLVGCLLIGFLFGIDWLSRDTPHRHFAAVGFLGSLTTLSTFGIETFTLLESGRRMLGGINIGANLVGGLLLVWCGTYLGRVWLSQNV